MSFRKLFGECCRASHCVHYPRETGGDPLVAAAKRTHAPEQRHVTEAHVQARLVQALIDAGWQVWRVGQRDARGTQDPGVSDLLAFRERLLCIEVKRPHGGRQSEAQRQFQQACERAGITYVLARSLNDLAEYLTLEAV